MQNEQDNDIPEPNILIYGDYFNQDTRSILAIIQIAEVYNYEFVEVDTFKHENLQEPFKLINPSGTIPLITEGSKEKPTKTIVGDKNVAILFNYLIDNHPKIS